ncbi:acyl-CoA dehydrogenase family protein [Altererythrobacter sp.]|uniref:acyl-CoA dehydrogenase family protein n=1 Tax=Altererythrobacter sp. TaxID=1872480 RepID=UPI001B076E0B|nr:acyl-CoA dehydrogenase family protein [Altererythrobacter sp.]MBO6608976.1 acyl-CoA dehydrogenase family protein [Altererythrobacter sp.]MBO6642515.1 acyl-CoA dehydrogenase family protein [Altererythrobacter sp.]MBO6708977.1 acyl-CoA dehydrogenase family protein [Altererythrobacter sp.]
MSSTPLFDQWRSRSPHYDETHEAVCDSVRTFVSREIMPHVDTWECDGELPRELHRKAAEAGVLGLGYPEEYGGSGTLEQRGFDIFHSLVQSEELCRPGAGGIPASLMIHGIGLPPVLAAGSEELKQRIAPQVLSGEKIICLGITEPGGGSDVANLKTRAERRGDRYIVNGAKTLITSGMRADFVSLAVRTGDAGMGGVSLLLVELESEGVSRTPLEKMGWHSSDTATIHFDDVEVPAENLIGPENAGFGAIMRNFNGERLGMAQQAAAYSRLCYEDALDWARERETFGRPLVTRQAIRHKLARMLQMIGATQAMIDHAAWTVKNECAFPGDFALLKVQATQTMEYCAREACQIMGGVSFVRGGRVERIYREVRVMAIGGGSEEIMYDLASRQFGF